MNKSLQLSLCDMQGQLFELSSNLGYDSISFIKTFMQSEIAKKLDSDFNHLQWAGKEYILESIEIELGDKIEKNGKIFDKETLSDEENEKYLQFEVFSNLVHSLGNFVLGPKGFNCVKGKKKFGDRMDLFFNGIKNNRNYIDWKDWFNNNQDSYEIYKQANAKTMLVTYLPYHTLSVELAIERLKESYFSKHNK